MRSALECGISEVSEKQGRAWDERSGVGLNLSIHFFLGVADQVFQKQKKVFLHFHTTTQEK